MNAVGERCSSVLIHDGRVGEVHQNRRWAAVARRLAHGAEAALEIGRDGHLQFPQPQLETNVCTLFPGGVVDGADQATVFGSDDGTDHFGAHPPQCASHHNGDLSGHRRLTGDLSLWGSRVTPN